MVEINIEINCKCCGKLVKARSGNHKYCNNCSRRINKEYQKNHYKPKEKKEYECVICNKVYWSSRENQKTCLNSSCKRKLCNLNAKKRKENKCPTENNYEQQKDFFKAMTGIKDNIVSYKLGN